MNRSKRYSPEVRERAVRLVFDSQTEGQSQWATVQSIADKIGCTQETMRHWALYARDGDVPIILGQGAPDMTKNVAWAPKLN